MESEKMRKFVLMSSLVLFTASMAKAADVAPVDVYDWTGMYVGVNAGYAWGETEATDQLASNGFPWNTLGDNFTADVDGFAGGAQAGYNFQANSMVFGIEADIGYLDLNGTGTSSLSSDTHVTSDGGYYGTVRGRLGYAADRVLVYGTGGLIFGDLGSYVYDDVPVGSLTTEDAGTQLGWTAGGGVEWAMSQDISLRLQYLYYDLGKERVGGLCCGGGVTQYFDVENTGSIVTAGVNFRF